ncbi:MAG: terpene cyclase/mutase family protein [Clostridia bacterium]|nr:terpene cyclase/mutase family protein [Clostridia bacterium]
MKKFLSLALCAVLLLAFATPAAASYRSEADAIIAYKTAESGAKNTAEWIKSLADGAGTEAEWYVMAASRLGYSDFEAYSQALAEYLGKNTQRGTNAQRCALAFIAAGCESKYIAHTAESTIGSQGIMSYIWGLILLSCGAESSQFTPEALAEKIVSFRLSDGGFALSGKVSNVDVTAMALAALAPYRESETVNEAVESSLAFLSSVQTENGGFISYGAENCESAAQVIIALTALGINPEVDARFIKNGKTAVDAVRSFAVGDGSFAHTAGAGTNEMATAQALHAFTALCLFENGGTLWSFEKPAGTPEGFRDFDTFSGEEAKENDFNVKNAVCIAVIAACAVGIAITALLPKKKKKEE